MIVARCRYMPVVTILPFIHIVKHGRLDAGEVLHASAWIRRKRC
jgi:hypothetical protein